MKILKTIRDTDIGSNTPDPANYEERKAVRAIVFDTDSKMALLHSVKKQFHAVPGGGIQEGEDFIEALKRESLEEIGCNIGSIKELGVIEEYRNKFSVHQVSYCFVADVIGEKRSPNFEEGEIGVGFEPVWMSLEEAITTLEDEDDEDDMEDYRGRFIRLRDLTFLKEAKAHR